MEMKHHRQQAVLTQTAIFVVVCVLLSVPAVEAGHYKMDFVRAKKAALDGNMDFAFMNYRSVLRGNPRGKYRVEALFANAEYYYSMDQMKEAKMYFNEYLSSSENANGKLFALIYQLKLAKQEKNIQLIKKIEKDVVLFQQQSFIFKKSKEYLYMSPMNREHKAVYAIDKIRFYLEGALFAEILL
jgi:tetratricopeptide (TPR) repeat protein